MQEALQPAADDGLYDKIRSVSKNAARVRDVIYHVKGCQVHAPAGSNRATTSYAASGSVAAGRS